MTILIDATSIVQLLRRESPRVPNAVVQMSPLDLVVSNNIIVTLAVELAKLGSFLPLTISSSLAGDANNASRLLRRVLVLEHHLLSSIGNHKIDESSAPLENVQKQPQH